MLKVFEEVKRQGRFCARARRDTRCAVGWRWGRRRDAKCVCSAGACACACACAPPPLCLCLCTRGCVSCVWISLSVSLSATVPRTLNEGLTSVQHHKRQVPCSAPRTTRTRSRVRGVCTRSASLFQGRCVWIPVFRGRRPCTKRVQEAIEGGGGGAIDVRRAATVRRRPDGH